MNNITHKINILNIIFFILLFIVNPFFCIIFYFIYLIIKKRDKLTVCFFCILLGLFIGCINSTKVVDSDLIWYTDFYKDASKYKFSDYIMLFPLNGKDPVFSAFNYLVSIITNNSVAWYLIILGGVTYSFLCISVYKLGKALRARYITIIFCITLMAFLPYIFTLSAHLLRQFFAASILFYIMVQRFFYDKKCWILIILMIFIHSTVILFLPFLFLTFFSQPISRKNITYYVIGIISIIIIGYLAGIAAIFLSPISSLEAVAIRANKQNYYEGIEKLSFFKIALNIFLVFIILYITYIKKRKSYLSNKGLMRFENTFISLVVFILINVRNTELSVRYNFFVWMFVPFLLLFVLPNNKKFDYLYIFSFFVMIFFLYTYMQKGIWKYNLDIGFFTNTFLHYII